MKRYTFKKWDKSEDVTKCDRCSSPTLFFVADKKTKEEGWCCLECALKHYKIKRLKTLLSKYPIRKKKTKKVENPLIKNSTITLGVDTSEVKE